MNQTTRIEISLYAESSTQALLLLTRDVSNPSWLWHRLTIHGLNHRRSLEYNPPKNNWKINGKQVVFTQGCVFWSVILTWSKATKVWPAQEPPFHPPAFNVAKDHRMQSHDSLFLEGQHLLRIHGCGEVMLPQNDIRGTSLLLACRKSHKLQSLWNQWLCRGESCIRANFNSIVYTKSPELFPNAIQGANHNFQAVWGGGRGAFFNQRVLTI